MVRVDYVRKLRLSLAQNCTFRQFLERRVGDRLSYCSVVFGLLRLLSHFSRVCKLPIKASLSLPKEFYLVLKLT